jgi:hypothetical protein
VRVNLYKGSVGNAGGMPQLPGHKRLAAALGPHHARLRAAAAAAAAAAGAAAAGVGFAGAGAGVMPGAATGALGVSEDQAAAAAAMLVEVCGGLPCSGWVGVSDWLWV